MQAGAYRDVTLRLALFFVATFAVIGLHLPFFPVFLQHRGFDPETIGIVLAVPLMIRVFAAPAIAFTADRLGAHRGVLIVLCGLATLIFAMFALTSSFWAILSVAGLFAAVWTSVIPMTESLAIAEVRRHDIDYGKVRSCGSFAFILASFAGGAGLEYFGNASAFWMILACLVLTVPAALALPLPRGESGASASPLRLADVARLARAPVFLLFVLATTLIQSAHALLYSFGTLHWQSIGISAWTIGLLWAIGTGAEIITFSFSAWPLRRFGPVNLILIGGAAGLLRWIVTALDPPAGVLALVQVLHALSFGATHLGAVYLMANVVPQRLGATAQGLYSAMIGGLGIGSMMMISGPLYATLAGHAFFVMAGISAAGLAAGILLSRVWDGRPVIEDADLSPKAHGPAA